MASERPIPFFLPPWRRSGTARRSTFSDYHRWRGNVKPRRTLLFQCLLHRVGRSAYWRTSVMGVLLLLDPVRSKKRCHLDRGEIASSLWSRSRHYCKKTSGFDVPAAILGRIIHSGSARKLFNGSRDAWHSSSTRNPFVSQYTPGFNRMYHRKTFTADAVSSLVIL